MKKEKNIKTDFLKIHGNCLEIRDTCIQLSNISLFSTTDIAPDSFPKLSILMAIIGMLLLKGQTVIGLLLLAASGIWVYIWYSNVQETKELKRLSIVTNSGNIFPIIFNDQAFLKKVVEILTDIISTPNHAKNITINVKDNTFTGESSLIRELNDMSKK